MADGVNHEYFLISNNSVWHCSKLGKLVHFGSENECTAKRAALHDNAERSVNCLFYLHQGGYVLARVCQAVCLLICLLATSRKTTYTSSWPSQWSVYVSQ